MSNYRVFRECKRIKRNRRRVEKLGVCMVGLGFLGLISVTGDQSILSLGYLILWCIVSCIIMVLGSILIHIIETLNEEHPVRLELVEKGNDMCYTISTKKQKERV